MGHKNKKMIDAFINSCAIDFHKKWIEICIIAPIEYEFLWSVKLTELVISYIDACLLIGNKPVYLDRLEEESEMVSEYTDKYWRVRKATEVEFHIRIPKNYKKLWVTKLAELTATDEEIEEYRDEVSN